MRYLGADGPRRPHPLARINATGAAYLSHTVLAGRYVLRLAVGNLRTTDDRLDATCALMERELAALRPD